MQSEAQITFASNSDDKFSENDDDDYDDDIYLKERRVENLMELCVQTLIVNRLFGQLLDKLDSMCSPLNHLTAHRKCFEQRWYEKNANYFALKGDYFCMRAHERMKSAAVKSNEDRCCKNDDDDEEEEEDDDSDVVVDYDTISGE